jgi:hypothetical protein
VHTLVCSSAPASGGGGWRGCGEGSVPLRPGTGNGPGPCGWSTGKGPRPCGRNTGKGPCPCGRGRRARASRRRPGQAEAASETPESGGLRGGLAPGRNPGGEMREGRHSLREGGTGIARPGGRWRRDAANVTETSPWGRRGRGQNRPVEHCSRIERVSLHSKALTDGAGVTSHEEAWGSAHLPHVTVTFSASPSEPRRPPPLLYRPGRGRGATSDLGAPRRSPDEPSPPPADPAISEAASACPGRLRDGRVPLPSAARPCDSRRRPVPTPASSAPTGRRRPPPISAPAPRRGR